eukprot:3119718-Pleurochrysis_carterae.AAC.1
MITVAPRGSSRVSFRARKSRSCTGSARGHKCDRGTSSSAPIELRVCCSTVKAVKMGASESPRLNVSVCGTWARAPAETMKDASSCGARGPNRIEGQACMRLRHSRDACGLHSGCSASIVGKPRMRRYRFWHECVSLSEECLESSLSTT